MLNFELIGIILFTILFIVDCIRCRKKRITVVHLFCKVVLYIYLFLLIDVTLFDIPFQKKLLIDLRNEGNGNVYNIIPFKSIIKIITTQSKSVALTQIGGNLILLFPLGVYLPILNQKMKKIVPHLFMVLGISVLIEFIQGVIGFIIQYHYRVVDIDDILLNLCGGFVGFWIYKLIELVIIRLHNAGMITEDIYLEVATKKAD